MCVNTVRKACEPNPCYAPDLVTECNMHLLVELFRVDIDGGANIKYNSCISQLWEKKYEVNEV